VVLLRLASKSLPPLAPPNGSSELRRSAYASLLIVDAFCISDHEDEKNADGSEGFIKTPTRRREAEPTFDFLPLSHLTSVRFDKREFFKTPSASSLLDEASPRASLVPVFGG
jgi:hypothetical protein